MNNTITLKRQPKTLEKINSEPLTWVISDQSYFLNCAACHSRRPVYKNTYEMESGIRILLLICGHCNKGKMVTFK